MKKILAFGASNSTNSINKQFAGYAAGQLSNAQVKLLDLNDFEMPLYSIDLEKANGIPEAAHRFSQLIAEHDGLVISLAEHNGNYSAAFKNLIDWTSRLGKRIWQEKPILLLSTAPGKRGGATVMQVALYYFPYLGGRVISHFSLPFFRDKFSAEAGILDADLRDEFQQALSMFEEALQAEAVVAKA